jgi:hypothetical protein
MAFFRLLFLEDNVGSNILRKFYYVDAETIDAYCSSIEGVIYESEEISEKSINNKGIEGSISALPLKVNGGLKSHIETETSRKVIQTYAGKFQKIFSYLEQNGGVPFYDNIDEQTWNGLSRNQFIELDVNFRFSKIDNLISSIGTVLPFLGKIDPSILNDDSKKTLSIMEFFDEINKQNGMPAELQLINGSSYKFVAYFNQDCFINSNMDLLPNEVTVFAKIQRKLRDNEKINLINIIPMLEKMAVNREMRRNMKHSISDLPDELTDNIKGPGAVIIPIAVYN